MDKTFIEVIKATQKILSLNIDEAYFARDFLRLAKHLTVSQSVPATTLSADSQQQEQEQQYEDKVLITYKNETQLPDYLADVMNACATLLNEDTTFPKTPLIKAEQLVPSVINEHVSFNEFCKETYTRDARFFRLLKLCDQGVIGSVIIALVTAISGVLPGYRTKDVSGSWKLFLHKNAKGGYRFSHRRAEQLVIMEKIRLVPIFQFSWQINIDFCDANLTDIDTVELQLLDIDTSVAAEELTKPASAPASESNQQPQQPPQQANAYNRIKSIENHFRTAFGSPKVSGCRELLAEAKKKKEQAAAAAAAAKAAAEAEAKQKNKKYTSWRLFSSASSGEELLDSMQYSRQHKRTPSKPE